MYYRSKVAIVALCLLASSCASISSSNSAPQALSTSGASISRQDAIANLIDEAFLRFSDAACIVDGVHAETDSYDINSAEALASVDQASIVAECTRESGESKADSERLTVVVTEAPTPTPLPAFTLTEASMPSYVAGGAVNGAVTIGGKTIEYVTITPAGFQAGSQAPVLLAFPPGGQNLEITRNVADVMYMTEAVRRGWVVVTPASPGGKWFDTGNANLMPEFITWIEAWVTPEGGKVHLGGMSNGGLSAFKVAAQAPNDFHSLMVYPGYPNDRQAQGALESFDFPVRMWVGGNDGNWVDRMEAAATVMTKAGVDNQLFVLPGEPHVLQSTQDGVALFNQLDAAR